MIKFILPFPPSVNVEYNITNGRRHKGKRVLTWESKAIKYLDKQLIQPVTGRVELDYELDTPDNRNRDDANYSKFVTDLLVSQGILKDDSRRYVKGTRTHWNDKKGRFVHVTITIIK